MCIPLRGNIPLGLNNLFVACYCDVGRRKLLETISLGPYQLVVIF